MRHFLHGSVQMDVQGLGSNEPKERSVIAGSMITRHLLWFVLIIRFA